jgi:hypothetical protein
MRISQTSAPEGAFPEFVNHGAFYLIFADWKRILKNRQKGKVKS